MTTAISSNIDDYIARFPPDVQLLLKQVRATIKEVAPEAQEAIKYAMPAFILQGDLVYFAAFKTHIGFYATPTAHESFQAELSAYKTGKGSVQFPLDQPMPLDLIARMVAFRVQQNLEKTTQKARKQPH